MNVDGADALEREYWDRAWERRDRRERERTSEPSWSETQGALSAFRAEVRERQRSRFGTTEQRQRSEQDIRDRQQGRSTDMTATKTEIDEVVALTPPEVDTPEAIPAETKALLELAGLDHVPTVEEAKALLEARKAEIRQAVMLEADLRDWCEDGTRKVCANLRLPRPGERTTHPLEVELRLKVRVSYSAYTAEGAVEKARKAGILSKTWLASQLYSTQVDEHEIISAMIGGIDLTPKALTPPEVTP